MSTHTFDESQHPRGEAGKFTTKPKGETDVSLSVGQRAYANELDTLQDTRERIQDRWRALTSGPVTPSLEQVRSARRDVELAAMHVLARDVLTQHPNADVVVLVRSDQEPGEMLATEVLDADGNVLSDDEWGFDDRYTAASDLQHPGEHAAWAPYARELAPDHLGPRWALDLRGAVAGPLPDSARLALADADRG